MTEHVERFTGRVADYERYRLRYPVGVLDILRERCGLLETSLVADVGAGTGMLAELFLENGNRVIAVEPNAEMREACERLRKRYTGLTVVAAAAEATTLEDASTEAKAYEEILMEFGMDYRELQSGYRVYDDMPPLFAGGAEVRETIRGEQVLTLEELLGQTQSLSVAPLPGDAKYAGMQGALRDFFARFQRDGVLRLGTACSVMACRVSAG